MPRALDLGGLKRPWVTKRLSPGLLALSVANRQLRRACLPFLFAEIKIRNDEDAKKLEIHLALCANFIKALFIGSDDFTQVGEQIISQILPQLEQLLDVELGRCSKRTDLLKAVLAHPSVTSVLVDEMPDESICNHDLSKMILDHSSLRSPANEKYFDRGMRLKRLRLDVVDSDSIDNQLKTVNFPGVKTIEIDMYDQAISITWLHRFSSTHPTLNELWLFRINLIEGDVFIYDTPPCLSLVEKYQPQGLHDSFTISEVGLRRAKPAGQSSQEWHVVELVLETSDSLIEKLSLLASSFPQIEILTLCLSECGDVYDIGELSSLLARFSCLRVVCLKYFAAQLSLDPKIEKSLPMPPIRRVDPTHKELNTSAEHRGLWAFASCLVKQVRTLNSVYIEDIGYEDDDIDYADNVDEDTGELIETDIICWDIEGRLHVLDGNRVISGTLGDFSCYPLG
ncbi:hypothetical protein EV360DRAFT_87069 [Lentinula raphanica]|nr:hypothetical protein EV360DRAFT_87069 [Lentinula raphanica]